MSSVQVVTNPMEQFQKNSNSSSNLGLGNDLDPKLFKWGLSGGIGGFLLWALTAPSSMPLHAFMHQRGPTQVWCMIFGGMLASFVINKWQILQKQERLYLAFEAPIIELIQTQELDALATKAEQSPSLLGKRLLRIISIWNTTNSEFQLERSADSDVELFELAAQSSYSLPKILLWAIPLLGFIGTVIGMSQAVGSFDQVLGNSENVEGLKNGLTKVTSGLGTAFDTTYLALVLSVIFAFPLNFCERFEERLLSQIDGEIREAITALSTSYASVSNTSFSQANQNKNASISTQVNDLKSYNSDEISLIIDDAFEKHLPDPSVLIEPAKDYARRVTDIAVERLSPLTDLVSDAVQGVSEARLSIQDQALDIQKAMQGISDQINSTLLSLESALDRIESVKLTESAKAETIAEINALNKLRTSVDDLRSILDVSATRKRGLLGSFFNLR